MKKNRKSPPQQPTKLSEHLREIRWRLFVCLLAFIAGGVAIYGFREPLFMVLQKPLDAPLYYTAPSGSFSFILRFSTIGALAALIPAVTYHILMFIRPAVDSRISRKRVLLTSAASFLLAILGIAFGFLIILPVSLAFFSGFQMDGLESLISADSYLNLVANILTVFALTFQIPLVISFIDHIHPLRPSMLLKAEKWVLLASLFVSVLVPFAWDMTTSLLIAAPIFLLYNIAILLVLLQHARRKASRKTKGTHQIRSQHKDDTKKNHSPPATDTKSTNVAVATVRVVRKKRVISDFKNVPKVTKSSPKKRPKPATEPAPSSPTRAQVTVTRSAPLLHTGSARQSQSRSDRTQYRR